MAWYKAQKIRPVYRYHVHSTATKDDFVETDEPTEVKEGLADNYTTTTPSGCFQQEILNPRTVREECWDNSVLHWARDEFNGTETVSYMRCRCNKSGYEFEAARSWGPNGWGYSHANVYTVYDRTGRYKCNCGHKQGELIYKED